MRDWQAFRAEAIEAIRGQVGEGQALLGLSGGVDSAVAALLVHEAVGERLTCIFVDHGLMRLHEGDEVEAVFAPRFGRRFIRINAQERFLTKLAGVMDPERKRKIIGEEFIRVFEETAAGLGQIDFLVQGTIYPDIVESGQDHPGGKTVKSHHNVGGLPENIKFKGIVEPLKALYKEEVRALGVALGLPERLANRQPFPGPGLGVRVLGEVTKEKLDVCRAADAIFREEMTAAGFAEQASQFFAVLTGTQSVGVRHDERTYEHTIVLRAVETRDFMTADWVELPAAFLRRVSERITRETAGVNRVVYDITAKPPATIEWE